MSSNVPNKAVMGVEGMSIYECRDLAIKAARYARGLAPKATLQSSSRFFPIYGKGFFGVSWEHPYIWYQEAGIRPFTMRSLAGKTIPMWLDDRDGKLRKDNPKAKTRTLYGGRVQVLVFRRAAKIGQRKKVWRNEGGKMVLRSVPASYPGAPGRIAVNRSKGIMRAGDVDPSVRNPGWIAKGNVGVRWRHPGLPSARFIARAIYVVAIEAGQPVQEIRYLNRWNSGLHDAYSVLVYQG